MMKIEGNGMTMPLNRSQGGLLWIGLVITVIYAVVAWGDTEYGKNKYRHHDSVHPRREQVGLIHTSKFPLAADFDVLDIGWLTDNKVVVFGTRDKHPYLLVLPGKQQIKLYLQTSSHEPVNWIVYPRLIVARGHIFLYWNGAVFSSRYPLKATTDLRLDPVCIFDLGSSPLAQLKDSIVSLRWAALARGVVWSACSSNTVEGPFHLTRGLDLGESRFASAISRDGKAFFVREAKRFNEVKVIHEDPLNDQRGWESIFQFQAYELFISDSIDWSDNMKAAVVSYTPDTAGALSFGAIIKEHSAKIVFTGSATATKPQQGVIEESPRWLRDRVILSIGYNQEKQRALLIYHPEKDALECPAWGLGGELPTPNADGSKITFLRRAPNGKGGQVVMGAISMSRGREGK